MLTHSLTYTLPHRCALVFPGLTNTEPSDIRIQITFTMPTQIASPIPVAPSRRSLSILTSQDLFASLNATLASKPSYLQTPIHSIREHDYTAPPPPPPSPVSFRTDHWSATSIRR